MSAAGTGFPGLTVVVLNYRNADATLRCLASLEAAHYDGPLEILLVENGSGDGSRERLDAAAAASARPVRVLVNAHNLGFAGGVNGAWPEVRTELVCLLNNDATVHPGCLRTVAAALAGRADLGAVWPYDAPPEWREGLRVPEASAVAALRNGTASVTGAAIWLPLLRDYRECFTASGVCLVTRHSAEPPFPDGYFAYHEDVFFGWRLRLRGLASERVPDAVIYHEGSAASGRNEALRPALGFHAEKNRLTNLLVCYESGTLAALAPLLLLDEARRWAAALAWLAGPRGADLLVAMLRARWWLVTHLGFVRRLRREVQGVRVVRDRAILPLLSGRLTAREAGVGAWLNSLSLGYCRAAGLPVCDAAPPGHVTRPMP